ncbi:hypothetical protein [Escherichia phage phiWec193]|uniref:Uncharacterized protein n=1 Tax=Escherichia phage phiWec193 TaxID=2992788 RepID=A0ACA8SAS9_9CAUD|nr:hypothetical protein [Escherichia phage phiWec193]BDU14476.1 hypothetical protein [Escherichia phage phiWec196]
MEGVIVEGCEYVQEICNGSLEYGANDRMSCSAHRVYPEKSILVFDPFSDFLRILKYLSW